MDAFSLDKRVALVTGASRGIGRATALRLARQGAAVALNYRQRQEPAESAAEEIRSGGGRALAVRGDVRQPTSVTQMVKQAVARLGPIDILVNNAGLLLSGELSSYDENAFDRMWNTNVKGIIHCCRAVVPSMRERRYGRIVNVSSIAALGTAFSGTTFYAATKAAVLILTKRFAFELGGDGINVNAVCPGFVATDMVLAGKSPSEVQRSVQEVAAKSALGRVGEPEDIAGAIGFLVSEAAAFITGQALTADGGRLDFLTHA